MRLRSLLATGLGLLAMASLSACQSTQSRSAELEAESENVLLEDQGIEVTKQDPEIKIVGTTVLSEKEGSAVVVELHNDSGQNLVDAPISVEVLDAKGKVVYTNDAPGLEQALVAVPFIPAGGDVVWVNDQVLATGTPKTARVKVGEGGVPYAGPQPLIEVSEPKVEGDPVSGLVAEGTVVNRTGEDQNRLLFYAVARKGGTIVAAGRGAIEHLKPDTKKLFYNVYFTGDPTGADVELSYYPTLETPGAAPVEAQG
ncbi:MAG TPA: hypothetical protein VFX45_09945 [Solirubrobacterales bacterium]|nr:hypothetical protein [Solirubrobacterales bacterium]